MKTDIMEGELSIDLDGLSISTTAKYEINSYWVDGSLIGEAVNLTEWKCGDEWRPRRDLMFIVGEVLVNHAEDAFVER